MADRPDFKKTQEISLDLAQQIANMSNISQVNLALNVIIPMDVTNTNHRGAPTTLGADGKIYIDTATLKQLFAQAVDARDPSLVPDVLNLQMAVKNILKKNPTITSDLRSHDTIPMIDAEAVREALRSHPAPPVRPRNTDFTKTTPFTPPKKP